MNDSARRKSKCTYLRPSKPSPPGCPLANRPRSGRLKKIENVLWILLWNTLTYCALSFSLTPLWIRPLLTIGGTHLKITKKRTLLEFHICVLRNRERAENATKTAFEYENKSKRLHADHIQKVPYFNVTHASPHTVYFMWIF